MDDCDMISEEGRSVQEVEKSYSDLHLSEQPGPETGCWSRSPSPPSSSSSDHLKVPQPVSITASSRLAAMEASDLKNTEDQNQSGASSEPSIPLQGAAGEPGGANVMSKVMTMMMMTNGEDQTVPGTSAMPESLTPDIMSMLKGEGGAMPPLSSMMSAMTGGGEDMPAMMKAGGRNGGAGPVRMAKIFDCIIDMSLARAESDHSDDDDDSATDELPCQYCCRCFSSQMTLKTHILVAHDQDDSVLNLTQLTISKKGRSPKDGSQRSRKRSEDAEVFASGASIKSSNRNSSGSESMSAPTDPAAAEFVNAVRGVKRGRTESKDLETVEKGGASGMEDPAREGDPQTATSPQELGAVSETSSVSGLCPSSQPDTPPMEMAAGSQSRPKKTRTKRFNGCNPRAAGEGGEEDSTISKSCAPVSLGSGDDARNADTKNRGWSSADQPSLNGARAAQGPQAAAAAGPSEQAAGESPTSARRSLRSHKSI